MRKVLLLEYKQLLNCLQYLGPGKVSPPSLESTTYSSDCNDLETIINKERKKYGLRSLGCDKGMRYVAYRHVTNQIDNGFQSGSCNLHSWAGDLSCCFTSDFRNNKCMWDKPKVSLIFLTHIFTR